MSELVRIQGSIVATWALAVITVCLRFLARRLSKAGLWYDDWLMIPATLVATALCLIYAIPMLLDDLFDSIPWFITEICWTVAVWITKYSILAFYWRLFSVNRRSTRITIWTLAAIATIWGLAMTLLSTLQFDPVAAEAIWHDSYYQFYLISSVPHVLIDSVLLGFPVPLIWKLNMQRSQKIMLTFTFALGILVTAVSIIRMKTLFEFGNLYFANWNGMIWTSVEVNISIICACLPSLRPILSFISEKLELLRKRKSTHKRGSKLLMDMLAIRRSASPPVLPISTRRSWDDGPNPMLDSSAILEVEARNPRAPELEAEAPGPHVLEIGTVESILEMYAQRPVAELEGIYATEIEGD